MPFGIDDKLLELATKSGCGRLQLFLLMSISATIVAVSMVANGDQDVEIGDGGMLLIIAGIVALCYGMIWLYVCRLFPPRE